MHDHPATPTADDAVDQRVGRRRLLTGAVAAGAGLLAWAAEQDDAVADTGTMRYGAANNAGATQTTLASSNNGSTIDVLNTGSGLGIHAISGTGTAVQADAGTGVAVAASSTGGTAISGVSTSTELELFGGAITATGTGNPGVYASSSDQAGVVGLSQGNDGVFGQTAADNQAGVRGIDGSSNGGHGVAGYTSAGAGVFGETLGTGDAMVAHAVGGSRALHAYEESNDGGIGIQVESANGLALLVLGRMIFSGCKVATVVTGKSSVTVPSPVRLEPDSIVFATAQTFLAGVFVASVVVHPSAGTFTVHLNKVASSDFSVACMVVG